MAAVPNALLNVPGTPYLARKTPHRAENRSSQLEHASADVRRTALGPFKPHTALGARGAELAFKDQAQLELDGGRVRGRLDAVFARPGLGRADSTGAEI